MEQIFTFFSLTTYLIIGKGALWFLIGYFGFLFLHKRGFNTSFINRLNLIELFMLFYLTYIILNGLFILAGVMIGEYLPLDLNNNLDLTRCAMAEGGTTSTSDGESVKVAKITANASNFRTGAVVTTASLAVGAKVANSMPTPLGKAAVVLGSGVLGVGLAGATKVISNLDGVTKSKLLGFDLNDIDINAVFGISSNNGLALLQYIQLFQDFALIFFIGFLYYSCYYFVDTEKLKVLFAIKGWNR